MLRAMWALLVTLVGSGVLLAYSKASVGSFWLGVGLCMLGQGLVFLAYCVYKLQDMYADSLSVSLEENHSLNPSLDYPLFPTPPLNDKIHFNRHTEEAILNSRTQALQTPALQLNLEDVTLSEPLCKREIQQYVSQMALKHRCLDQFNRAIVTLGQRLRSIGDAALLIPAPYSFVKNQQPYKNPHFNGQLREEERRALAQLKAKLRSPKGDENCVVLPAWQAVMDSLEAMGRQFAESQDMRESNSKMLEMISRKIMEDYEVLESGIKETAHNLQACRENLQVLKEEQKKLDIHQRELQGGDSNEVIYWLKKQYFEFTNLTLRIKQNQVNYKAYVQKARYLTAKSTGFYRQQKERYDAILITRYISFLDSYRITLQQSHAALEALFHESAYHYPPSVPKPPKVAELVRSKNVHEMLSAQDNYQREYFDRVDHYMNRLSGAQQQMEAMGLFLTRLRDVFAEMVVGLRQQSAQYFRMLFQQLEGQGERLYAVADHLQSLNATILQRNQPKIASLRNQINQGCRRAQAVLRRLRPQEGPIREKYRLARAELGPIYREVEEGIGQIKQLWQNLQEHFNRTKKIIVVSVVQFVAYQQNMIAGQGEGDFLRKATQLSDYLPQQPNDPARFQLTQQIALDKESTLDTGFLIDEQKRKTLNRFLFVAYTQWADSQLFKATISQQIYIALNEDVSKSVGQINIDEFQLKGPPPELLWARELSCDEGEVILDLSVAFRGTIFFKVSTTWHTVLSIPVQVQISVQQFYSVLRICFISNQLGRSWISFVGQPLAKIIVTPRLGSVSINFDSVVNYFQNLILQKLKESVYPIKKKISIPLYRKDDSYDEIKERFRSMQMMM